MMDGWMMDGWMDGCVGGWMGRWVEDEGANRADRKIEWHAALKQVERHVAQRAAGSSSAVTVAEREGPSCHPSSPQPEDPGISSPGKRRPHGWSPRLKNRTRR